MVLNDSADEVGGKKSAGEHFYRLHTQPQIAVSFVLRIRRVAGHLICTLRLRDMALLSALVRQELGP